MLGTQEMLIGGQSPGGSSGPERAFMSHLKHGKPLNFEHFTSAEAAYNTVV